MCTIMRHYLMRAMAALVAICCVLRVAAAEPGVAITYDLPQDGRVSMVVYDIEGSVMRELLHAAPRKQGRNTETWDGLDEKGDPAPAGTYTWKLLLTQGLRAEYLVTLGTNPTPPWDTWPGNHNGVGSVAVDDGGMYVATSSGEGTILGLKQTLDGRRIWSIPHWVEAWRGGHAMASAGGTLFMLHTNGAIHLFDSATGKHLGKWDVSWEEADRKNTSGIMDLDASGETLVVSYKNHNTVRWLSLKDRSVLDVAAVPEPEGVAVDPSGRVLFISKNEVFSITRDDKTPRKIITGLVSPSRLDVEDETGDIFVVQLGESQQVKRFSKNGKPLKEYGLPGGRPFVGRFDPKGFHGIVDIAADQQGGFVACEVTSPRRTVRVNKEGKLVRQWFGGQRYSNFACPDPVDPTTVWMQSQWGTTAKLKVDYKKKAWEVHTVYLGDPGDVRRGNGRTYLCTSGQLGKPMVYAIDEENIKRVPIADLSGYGFGKMCSLSSGFAYLGYKNNKIYRIEVKEWTDDGKPVYEDPKMLGEVPAAEGDLGSREAGPLAEDADGNIYGVFNGGVRHPPYGVGWWASTTSGNRVVKWDKTGKFLWTIGRHAPGPRARPGEGKFLWGPLGAVKGCILARDVEAPVHVWDKDGLWVGTLFDNPDTEAAPLEAYTGPSECFYGSLYVVPTAAEVPGLKPGEVLFYGSGQNNNPVFRISGWDKFRRHKGTITVTAEQAARIAEDTDAELADVVSIPHVGLGYMNVVKVDGKLDPAEWRNAKVLEIKHGGEVRAKVYLAWEAIYASMNARHGLCAAFDVNTDMPWKSASTLERAFEGGAAVDICLGPVEPKRNAAGPGDTRVVAAPVGQDGKTLLAEFMPKLPPGWGNNARKPVTYEGKTGKVTFDRVAPLNAAWTAAEPKPDGSGYVVEMLIPLRPPLFAQPRLRFRLDASVVLTNEDGTKSVLRLPWHSQDAGDRAVEDTYNQSILRPHTWSEVMLVN